MEYTKEQYKTEFYLPAYKGQKERFAVSLIHFQHIRIILEVFFRCIVVATTVFTITLTDIFGKANVACSSIYLTKHRLLPQLGQVVLLPGRYFCKWNLYSLMVL